MKRNLLYLAGFIVVIISSCKKKNEPTRQDYLTTGKWKMVSLEYKVGTTGTWIDGYAAMQACKKDDETAFRPDGVYLVTEGATKCSPTDPSTVMSSTWSLSSDIKKIIFPAPLPEWVILKLDETELSYTYTMDIGPFVNYYRVIMQH
ncbi:MAG: hypothetical protein J0L54_08225 [Chitinophagales bacterium]|nr:hypothetical protein [Chitinophagales bacterium]